VAVVVVVIVIGVPFLGCSLVRRLIAHGCQLRSREQNGFGTARPRIPVSVRAALHRAKGTC
ncbi:MAG: hypothetical protein V5A46_10840, partial [Haloferacaceae archaeon]